MNKIILSISLLLLFCMIGCRKTELEKALQEAGTNRPELETVLEHYRHNPADSLKYRAACFLIENMRDRSYYCGAEVDETHHFLDSIYALNYGGHDVNVLRKQFYKTARHQTDSDYVLKKDIESIKSDFLIRHIDAAFAVRQKPWLKKLSFENFCEYILPYRVSEEEPEDWRSLYAERFGKGLNDSCQTVICRYRQVDKAMEATKNFQLVFDRK